MRQNSDSLGLRELPVEYVIGSEETLEHMAELPALEPFSKQVCRLLQKMSRQLFSDALAKTYPDVVTLAFWLRAASLEGLRKRFLCTREGEIVMGRGLVFHVAPSNVPVNYAYSLAVGLLCGNANVVRLPSKAFPQVEIINRALAEAIGRQGELADYVALVRYGHERAVNDALSALADVRVVWGGDGTIGELRQSPLGARAAEITFADRWLLAVIDSVRFLETGNPEALAEGFYNDTYLADQNACTSPRIVVWLGKNTERAKSLFWGRLGELAGRRYELSAVQAVGKLASAYRLAAAVDGVRVVAGDNRLVRVQIPRLWAGLMEYKDNSGFFIEYDCRDIGELRDFCNDRRCQTLAYYGNPSMFLPLVKSGIRGIDRIVPIGRTMDFDLIWDGCRLCERLTRTVAICR